MQRDSRPVWSQFRIVDLLGFILAAGVSLWIVRWFSQDSRIRIDRFRIAGKVAAADQEARVSFITLTLIQAVYWIWLVRCYLAYWRRR